MSDYDREWAGVGLITGGEGYHVVHEDDDACEHVGEPGVVHSGTVGDIPKPARRDPQWTPTDLVVVNGTELNTPIPPAHSVLVDNLTGMWALVASRFFIPPRTIGWVLHLPTATSIAHVQWVAPPGVTQGPKGSNPSPSMFTTWTDECLEPVIGEPMIAIDVANTGQASVTSTATQIIAANPLRTGGVVITNTAAAGGNTVYIGGSTVTTGTGEALLPQGSITFNGPEAIYGIAASSTTVTYAEETA